jgi:hypothetical protein
MAFHFLYPPLKKQSPVGSPNPQFHIFSHIGVYPGISAQYLPF